MRALRRSGRPICQSEYQRLARKRALREMRWERLARSTPGSRGAAVMRERWAAEKFRFMARASRVVADAQLELRDSIDHVVRHVQSKLTGIGR